MSEKKWIRKTRDGVFWGVILLLAAVLLIMQGIGIDFGYEFSVWRIILGLICLAWLIDRLVDNEYSQIVFPLAFEFLIFEAPLAHALGRDDNDLINNWVVLVAALLATIGLGILLPKKYTEGNPHHSRFGSSTLYFDATDLSNANIHDNMGSVNAYITNRDAYPGGGQISVFDNMGKVKLHLPESWNVTLQSHDNMGHIYAPEQKSEVFTKQITVDVHDNMGSVTIVYD